MATSAITIEELTGSKRRLYLIGPGLPLKGASFGSATIVSTTWNNGNPEATQQVLTPQELPSDWEGVWRTTQLLGCPCIFNEGNNTTEHQVGLAFELKQALDLIRLGGQLLRVTWTNEVQRLNMDGSNGAIHTLRETRLGRLTEFIPTYATLDDIQWKATFEWVSRGAVSPKTVQFNGEDLVAATRDAMQKQDAVGKSVANSLLRALKVNGFRQKNYTNQFTLGQLEQIAKAPLDIVDSFARTVNGVTNRMQHVADLILQVRDTPAALAGKAFDVATGAVGVATNFCDQISRKGPEQQIAGSRLSTLTRTASYFSGVQTQAQFMEAANNRFAQQARRRRSMFAGSSSASANNPKSGDLLDVHIPRDGETMTTIALHYYKADLGAELAKANGLPAWTIKPPSRTPLYIPTRSNLESRAVSTT